MCFVAVTLLDLVAEFGRWELVVLLCRVLAMPLLVAWLATTALRRSRLVILVVIALGFSWLGDVVGTTVVVKIAFFLAAQIVYVVAFRPYWRMSLVSRPLLLIVYLAALSLLVGGVAIAAGPLAVPVAVYGASLAAMAVLATGVSRLAGLGGALFLLSDIVLAVEFFVSPGAIPHAAAVNMALYLPAQLAIVAGVLTAVAADETEPALLSEEAARDPR